MPHLPLYQYRGAYRVPLMNLSVCLAVRLSVCLSVCLSFCLSVCLCVCVTFVVFTDCESCTRPISTSPGSMEAGEHGLTRGTRFVACRLEVVAGAWLLWISWCVFLGAASFCVFFSYFVFSPNANGLLQVCMRPPCLIYLSTSTGMRTRHHHLISLSVCLSVCICATFVVF